MSDETPLTDELLELSLVQVRGYSKIFHGKPVAVRPAQRGAPPPGTPTASQGMGTAAPRVSVGKAPVGRKPLPTGAAKAVKSAQANAASAASKAATAAAKLKAAQQAANNKATAQQLALQTAQLRAATNAQILKNRLAVSNARTAAALARTKQQQQNQQQKQQQQQAKANAAKTGTGAGGTAAKSSSSSKTPKLGGGLLRGAMLARGLRGGRGGGFRNHPLLRHAGGLLVAGRGRNSGSAKAPKSSQEKANVQKASQKLVSDKELAAAERALHIAADYRKAHGRGRHRVPIDFHEKLALSSELPDFDADLFDLQGGLALYGYPVQVSGRMDAETADSLEAYLNACLEEEEDAGSDV